MSDFVPKQYKKDPITIRVILKSWKPLIAVRRSII